MWEEIRYRMERFRQALTAQVSREEVEQAIGILSPVARALFCRQAIQDQRHALAVWRSFQQAGHLHPIRRMVWISSGSPLSA